MSQERIFENMSADDGEKIKAYLQGAEAETQASELVAEQIAEQVAEAVSEGAEQDAMQQELCAESAQNDKNIEINEQKIGKFKNPQELLRAYGELEKEFTRRSQRLRELESGKQSLKSDEDWKGAVDKFFKEIPSAKAFAKDIANEIMQNPELREDANCLNVALTRVLLDKFRTPEQLMTDGQFLNDYVFSSEKVREAIIANYLDGVRQGMPPYTLHGGGMQCVAPKVKPKTIEEAGFMFLKNNK